MKNFFLIGFLLAGMTVFSQNKLTAYLELRGSVDALGNIVLDNVVQPKKTTKADSLINYASIKKIIALREPVSVMEALSEAGWMLVAVTQVSSDKEGRPNSPFMLYYFKKEIDL